MKRFHFLARTFQSEWWSTSSKALVLTIFVQQKLKKEKADFFPECQFVL